MKNTGRRGSGREHRVEVIGAGNDPCQELWRIVRKDGVRRRTRATLRQILARPFRGAAYYSLEPTVAFFTAHS